MGGQSMKLPISVTLSIKTWTRILFMTSTVGPIPLEAAGGSMKTVELMDPNASSRAHTMWPCCKRYTLSSSPTTKTLSEHVQDCQKNKIGWISTWHQPVHGNMHWEHNNLKLFKITEIQLIKLDPKARDFKSFFKYSVCWKSEAQLLVFTSDWPTTLPTWNQQNHLF